MVSAKYSAPQLLDAKLGNKAYRDVYIDLNSASDPATKAFIEDMGANGLRVKRDGDDPFDTYEMAGKRVAFDSDWKKQKMSEQDYMKMFGDADQQYVADPDGPSGAREESHLDRRTPCWSGVAARS